MRMKPKNANGRLKGSPSPELQGPQEKKRDVSDMQRKNYTGASSIAPPVYVAKKATSPETTGVFATGRRALAKGLTRRGGVPVIPPSSMSVQVPLTGRGFF